MKRAVAGLAMLLTLGLAAAVWAEQAPSASGAAASPEEIDQNVVNFLRNFYAWGADFTVKADPPTPSPVPDLYQVPVEISYKGQTDKAILFVSHDGKFMIRGTVDNLLANPFAKNRTLLQTADHPYDGAAKACVNVDEFSDFECPHCKELTTILQQVEPRYPQVRFTYFDFPLEQIHPWAMTAALAGRCAYQQNPTAYKKYRQAIFDNQESINPTNASDELLSLATQSGLDKNALLACMSTPETRKTVDDDIQLGRELNVNGGPVNSTPTVFVNGRPMEGGSEQLLDQFIDYELAQCPKAEGNKGSPAPGNPQIP